MTRGFLCAKVAKYLDRVYSPERVLYPMRRVGPKGPRQPSQVHTAERPTSGNTGQKWGTPISSATGDWQRISWDEALDEITSRFRAISAEFGSEAILPYSYGGTLGALNGGSMDRRFFHRLGASQLDRTICSAAGEAGLKSVLGVKLGTEPEQFRAFALHHCMGCEHPRQQRSPVAVHRGSAAQGREAGGDRSLPHAHRGLRGLVSAHQSRDRRGAGAGNDARHHQRGSA